VHQCLSTGSACPDAWRSASWVQRIRVKQFCVNESRLYSNNLQCRQRHARQTVRLEGVAFDDIQGSSVISMNLNSIKVRGLESFGLGQADAKVVYDALTDLVNNQKLTDAAQARDSSSRCAVSVVCITCV